MEEKDQSKTEVCKRKDLYSLSGGLVQEKEHFDCRFIAIKSLVSAKKSTYLGISMHLLSYLRYLSWAQTVSAYKQVSKF